MDLMMMRRAIIMGQPTEPAILPEFYDRLVFDGTAFIQTDYVLPALGSITMQCGWETVKSPQVIFFISYTNDGNNGTGVVLGNGTTSTQRNFAFTYDGGAFNSNTLRFTYASYNMFLTPIRFGYGTSATALTRGDTAPGTGICFGGGRSYNTPFTGSIKTVLIYDSSAQNVARYDGFASYTPVATFRPCLYEGEAGLWHVEGRRFYGNTAGAGTLTVSNA